MSFTVVTSDDPRVLVERFARGLRDEPLSPFAQERVVIQSYGMERWIRLELARRLGCAASVDFSFPAALCHALAASLGAGELDERFGRDALAWRIFEVLSDPDVIARPELATLARFVARGDDRARLGLATRLAARFDDYQLYRPEVLLTWEAGGTTHEAPNVDAQALRHVAWQAALWRELCAGEEPMHLARWFAVARERLLDVHALPAGFPSRLTIFGVSTLPDLFMKLLRAASRFVPVTMYAVAPPRRTWQVSDTPPANPLVRAFAGSVRGLLTPLVLEPDVQWEELHASAEPSATVLATLQADVRAGIERGPEPGLAPRAAIANGDDSLSVHVCHSELREMEVLRDQLLAAFDADPSLRPHDVLVMVPDVAKYAPFVESVFGVEEPGMPFIPFHVADRPVAQESSLAQGLLRLLALGDSRLTTADVLGLLDVPAISRGAGLGESGGVAATRWVEEAAIRWGRDGAMRQAEFDLPALDCNTWREGLDRLLLGYATGPSEDVVDGLLPVAGDTLGDVAELGAFADWTTRLFERIDDWRTARPLTEWAAALRDGVAEFIAANGDREASELARLTAAVTRLERAGSASGAGRPVSLALVRQCLERELGDEGFGSQLLTGGMTVCALKPMRTIPFRVIAVAGLDDASFPRRTRRAGYDLLEIDSRSGLEPRLGADRDVRSDDRQLFFDTLLAARERLILSYVGRSARDNKARAQSVVLAELFDVVDRAFESGERDASGKVRPARERLVVEHRLQPFATAYFSGEAGARLFTYSQRHATALAAAASGEAKPRAFVDAPSPLPDDELVIRVDDLVDCWRDPSRFYARRALDLRLAGELAMPEDSEPLVLDGLGRFRLRDEALGHHLRGARDRARERARFLGSGVLPPAMYGEALFDAAVAEADLLVQAVGAVAFTDPLDVSLSGDGWRLVGRVRDITPEGRLHACASKAKAKDAAAAWILHVAMTAQLMRDGRSLLPTRFVARDVDFRFAPVAEPLPILEALVRGYRQAHAAPLPFFPECSREFVRDKNSRYTPIQRAAMQWTANEWSKMPLEGDDAYAQLCWRDRNPFADEGAFATWAEAFWKPAAAAAEKLP